MQSILALYAQPDFDNGNVISTADASRLHARFADYPDYTLYVAERGSVVVGSFALLVMDNLGHLGAPSAIVEDVVVAASLQGGGIGGAMMSFACDMARRKRCYKLMLSSNARRERAHIFYESLTFERHGYSFRLDLEPVSP
ncbi:MAG: GNAT family N-acetyltransferase [Hyphomicrobiales bacterium]|nr:GNAT family N-acetyltransferase [Alphaproteobacteria bacterium]